MDYGQVVGSAGQGAAAGSAAGPWGALIGGGLGLAGGLMGAQAASDAAAAQARANREALEFAQRQFDTTRGNLSPFLETGVQANQRLGDLVAGMQQPGFDYQQKPFEFDEYKDPGAQYAIDQAMQALNASSLAKGGMGGGAIKAMTTQAANLGLGAYQGSFGRWMDTSNMLNNQAQQKYGRDLGWQSNVLDRNTQLSGAGQNAAAGLGGFAGANASLGSGLLSNIGGAEAAGKLMGTNALITGLGQFGKNAADYIGSQPQANASNWEVPEYQNPYKGARLGDFGSGSENYGGGYN